jgi:large subunit ribosomal protein L25
MSQVTFAAAKRQVVNKGAVKRLRKAGRIPAVVYGHTETGEPISIDLDAVTFTKGIRTATESTIVTIEIEGGASVDAFVKDSQRNVLDGSITHVDFYAIKRGELLRAHVGLKFKGNPIGVRNGGVFDAFARSIEVECLPKDLPERIELDISTLDVNQSIHVRDLALGEGVRVLTPGDEVIAQVKYTKSDAPVAAEAAAAAPAADEAKKK